MTVDPQNIVLNTLVVELCAPFPEIWRNIHFSVIALLLCIKVVCGAFWQLINIADRFLWHFSNLETLIRNIFPRGARYPLLPTRLNVTIKPHRKSDTWSHSPAWPWWHDKYDYLRFQNWLLGFYANYLSTTYGWWMSFFVLRAVVIHQQNNFVLTRMIASSPE